ncbi:AraC family transcriptional regulator [Lutibacter sp. B1]|uniref:helix-turn-helix domain-containing protein n=1 Tax=Lutibacter sp. B1 TaxID=2725996 RepID=UPI00145676D5|nr:response regulator transcription factor [Lutibacter sp. B1]NLP58659.1 helix-turn-helix transcriptional regulator [Lutibacter sp. B1]
MKIIQMQTSNIQTMLEQFNNLLGGDLTVNTIEHFLELNNKLAKGCIKGYSFKGGVSALQYNLKFREDYKIKLDNSENNPIYFIYCSKGSIEHAWNNGDKRRKIERFQTSILSAANFGNGSEFYFKKDEYCKVLIIRIERKSDFINFYKDQHLDNNQFSELFSEIANKRYEYIGSYNLKIADQINQLSSVKEEGIIKSLLIEGRVHLILAMEIEQRVNELNNNKQNRGSLTNREMSLLREVSEQIQKEPDYTYTIKYLCKKTGLSASKLQEGFKLMHNKTVTEFIRNVRIETAEKLMKTTDMNISQIVYSIGFSSRSYFSKIFKEKYNCSPSFYLDSYKTLPTAI